MGRVCVNPVSPRSAQSPLAGLAKANTRKGVTGDPVAGVGDPIPTGLRPWLQHKRASGTRKSQHDLNKWTAGNLWRTCLGS